MFAGFIILSGSLRGAADGAHAPRDKVSAV